MRPVVLLIAVAAAFAGVGCGSEIGDSCIASSDCEQSDATRICDTNSDGGYCTIVGCDYGTCPKEAECVRFFTGVFENKMCSPDSEDCIVRTCNVDKNGVLDPTTPLGCAVGTCPHTDKYASETPPTDDCTADELCALDGHCVTRASEIRYCMRTCSSTGDCRSGYECRNGDLMKMHGGEPVPPPGERLNADLQAFCAQAPTTP